MGGQEAGAQVTGGYESSRSCLVSCLVLSDSVCVCEKQAVDNTRLFCCLLGERSPLVAALLYSCL
jgi:hypothetical protein